MTGKHEGDNTPFHLHRTKTYFTHQL